MTTTRKSKNKIEGFVINDEINIVESQEEILNRQSPNWTKYILSQLEDDECDIDKLDTSKKYPRTDGLRRLLEKEVSPINNISSTVIQFPNPTNNMIATVKTTLHLENGESYEAVADAIKEDIDYPFDRYVTALAETRSEGRAYRKALRLKNVVTKEELILKTEDQPENNKINRTQISMIDVMCSNDKLNINVKKLLEHIFKQGVKLDISLYTHEEAASVNRILNEYQSDMSKIPDEIKGYNPNWK